VSVQPRDLIVVPQKPPTQTDVLINESALVGPSFKFEEREGSLAELNVEAQMLVRTEAGRHNVSNEELRPSSRNPLLEREGALESNAP